jgi:hypothetical protein
VRGLISAIAFSVLAQGCGGGGGGGTAAVTPNLLQLDFSDPYRPVISGVTFQCTDYLGRPVAFLLDTTLGDVGLATPAKIALNPNKLAGMPATLQHFWAGHECAHHTNGASDTEPKADCVSIAEGKRAGLFTRRDVETFEPWFLDQAGSTRGHLPGPLRYQNLLACFDAA